MESIIVIIMCRYNGPCATRHPRRNTTAVSYIVHKKWKDKTT